MRTALIAFALSLAAPAALDAAPTPRPKPQKPETKLPEQKPPEQKPPEQKEVEHREADRHFKSGVELYKEGKYGEALAEFARAYEIAPHPLVLYNIAGCHRELLHYAEAVTYYRRFLADGPDKVPAARLTAAQADLDTLLALIARVTVTITPASDDAALILDGMLLDHPTMPLILPPGEHRLVARAAGRRDAEKTMRVAPRDELTVALVLGELPVAPVTTPAVVGIAAHGIPAPAPHRQFALGAGFGTNLRLAQDTGAPSFGVAAAIGSRLELGADVVLVAYAVIPSVRVRVVGDALALHVVGAVPVARSDGPMSEWFVAGALGLGLRYRPVPRLAVRLESYASFAGKAHGSAIPTFLGGELWF